MTAEDVAFVAAMLVVRSGDRTVSENERLEAIAAPYLRDRFNFEKLDDGPAR
jgi:CTP-dependent riboflavin kinase